jgi:hypothetical protein
VGALASALTFTSVAHAADYSAAIVIELRGSTAKKVADSCNYDVTCNTKFDDLAVTVHARVDHRDQKKFVVMISGPDGCCIFSTGGRVGVLNVGARIHVLKLHVGRESWNALIRDIRPVGTARISVMQNVK